MGTYLKMPAAGVRLYNTNLNHVDVKGFYWSSTPRNNSNAYALSFSSSNIQPDFNDLRSNGFPIRCLKDSPVAPTSSWTTLYD